MGGVGRGRGEAVGWRSSSTIVGLHWESVAAGGTAFVGSAPVAGKVRLEGVLLSVDRGPVAEDPHRVQLAVATDVPGSQDELDAAEQIFPRASQAVASRFAVVLPSAVGALFVPVGGVVGLHGRRFVGGFYNGDARSIDVYVGLVVHRVSGGAFLGRFGFLWGEAVREI